MIQEKYKGKNVFISGITGFKGAWLALLLHKMGANVSGLGLEQENEDTIYVRGKVNEKVKVYIENLCDDLSPEATKDIQSADFIFHLAAQAIVSEGYRDPYYTFNTNVMGTVKLLELIKNSEHKVSFLSVASDRVYASVEHPHVESDPLAGFDPYSLSKVFDNMLIDLYAQMDGVSPLVKFVNARASNVLGGGDRGVNRIVTSIVESAEANEPLKLRNISFVRPYLYVLDCLGQYLYLAAEGTHQAYNIGAGDKTSVSVKELVETFINNGYPDLTYNTSGKKFGFEGNTLLVNTDLFHSEFPELKSITNTIEDIVIRIQQINLIDKENQVFYDTVVNELLDEALAVY